MRMRALIVSFLLWIICTQMNFAQPAIETIFWKSEDEVVELSYPQIKDTSPIYQQLNELIADSIHQWKKDFEQAYEFHRKEPAQQVDPDEDWKYSWGFDIGGNFSYMDQNYLSLHFSIYDNRALLSTIKDRAFNFRIGNQRLELLSVNDIIKDKKKFPFLVWETLLKQGANPKNKYLFLKQNLESLIESFSFYPNGINLFFKYEIELSSEEAIYGEVKSVFIEWSVLKEIVYPKIKKDIIDKYPNLNLQISYIQNLDTLVNAEKIKVRISKTDLDELPKPAYPFVINYKTLIDTLQFDSWYEKPQAIENYHILNKNPHFEREGIYLKLPLANNQYHILADDTSYTNTVKKHYYLDFMEEVNHHLIAVSYWEGARYLLVCGDTDEELYLNGLPLFSSNHHYFLTTAYDIGYVYNTDELNIWELQSNKTRLIGKFSFDHRLGLPWRAEWLNNQSILLELKAFGDCNEGQVCKNIIRIDIH